MTRLEKAALLTLLAAAADLAAALFGSWAAALFTCLPLALCSLCLCAAACAKRLGRSPWRALAVTDAVLSLLAAAWSVHNMLTDTGWFAGLAGLFVLLSVLPAAALVALTAFFVWRQKGRGA